MGIEMPTVKTKDDKWVGRFVEFREPKTLGQSYYDDHGAKIFLGRITKVFKRYNQLYAIAEPELERELLIG